jgi:hypothetical protein
MVNKFNGLKNITKTIKPMLCIRKMPNNEKLHCMQNRSRKSIQIKDKPDKSIRTMQLKFIALRPKELKYSKRIT